MRDKDPLPSLAAPPPSILIVDDERSMRELLSIMLRKHGYLVSVAEDGLDAIGLIEAQLFDLVITDLSMPNADGMAVLQRCKEVSPTTSVIMVTAYATTESAVEAMKKGAFDYIIKPFKVDELRLLIEKALQTRRLEAENQRLRQELESRYGFDNLVGRSPRMLEVYDLIRKVKDTRINVLICGESGTGKELVARAIHFNGVRKDFPFVTVNCGAIPEDLIESELFGHKKGSFTGAITNKPGLFQAAHGGSLFLDEVTEMPLNTQVKLLRAIQERAFKSVGSLEDVRVDIRIMAATNRDLEEEVRAGRFREDLFYRLNVIQIHIPPLRERMEDLPMLADHFLAQFSAEYGKPVRGISEAAMRALLAHGFPGNIRELSNVMERAVALEASERVQPAALPPQLLQQTSSHTDPLFSALPPEGIDLDQTLDRLERQLVQQALERTGGVKKRAARLLGVSFRSLRYRLNKLGIDSPDADDELEEP